MQTNTTTRVNTGAFTLVELLIVISIIAVLAALVLGAAGGVQKKASRSKTEAEIAALQTALEGFKADNGDYPVNPLSMSNKSSCLVSNLMPPPGTGKVYFEFKPKSLDTNSNPIDAFGYTYNYVYDPTNGSPNNGTNNYDLWSTAGSPANSNAWIKNW